MCSASQILPWKSFLGALAIRCEVSDVLMFSESVDKLSASSVVNHNFEASGHNKALASSLEAHIVNYL